MNVKSGRQLKKWIVIGFLFVVMLCTTGCTQVIELTDEENHLIAEYAAELLLKYDKYYKQRYNPDDITEAEVQTETEAVTETTTETTESDVTETVATTEEDFVNTSEAPQTPEQTIAESVSATVDSDFDIAAFIGEERISIRYAYYMIADRYPSYDQDGMYIEIEAPEGYKLLVLKFNVENKTNEPQDIDLYSRDVNYNIIVDNSRKTKQMFTILMDDLYTYEKTIDASSREEVVLLYTLSDSVAEKLSDLKLQVEYGETSAVLQLQ